MKMTIEVTAAKDGLGVEWTATFHKQHMNGEFKAFRSKSGSARTYDDAVSDAALFVPLVLRQIADGGT